jgi:hypothetical protein
MPVVPTACQLYCRNEVDNGHRRRAYTLSTGVMARRLSRNEGAARFSGVAANVQLLGAICSPPPPMF